MKKLRVGFIGSGLAAKELHLPALKQLTDIYEITAVSSPNFDHAKAFANLCGENVRPFNVNEDLFRSGLIDVVDIVVPVNFNYQMIKDAFESGLDVICEKPIAENIESARKILDLCEAYPESILYIAESQRHDPAIEIIKASIPRIGNVAFFNYKLIISAKGGKYANTEWRKHPKHVGGFLSDGGVHHIAFLNGIFGQIESVNAFVKQISNFTESYDTMTMNVKYKSGIFGNYSVSYGLDLYPENEFDVYGANGMLKLNDSKLKLIENGKIEEIKIPYTDFFVSEFREFYGNVSNRTKPKLGDPSLAFNDLYAIEKAIRLE